MLILTKSNASLLLSLCSFVLLSFVDVWCFIVRVFPTRLLLCLYRISSQHHLCCAKGLTECKDLGGFFLWYLVHTHWVSWEKKEGKCFEKWNGWRSEHRIFKMPTLRGEKIIAATCPPITLWKSGQDLPPSLCANGKCKH
jgi:hypothetical protein